MVKQSTVILTAITFTLFLIEALIHYNIGIRSHLRGETAKPEYISLALGSFGKLHLPGVRDLVEIVAALSFFSLLDGFLSSRVVNAAA